MKLLKAELEQIIKEEIEKVLKEYDSQAMAESPSHSVKVVQNKLGLKADGILGPGTKQAIAKFQKSRGLKVDGTLGSETLQAMGINLKEDLDLQNDDDEGALMNRHFANQARSKQDHPGMAGTTMRSPDNLPFGAPGTGENNIDTFMKSFTGGAGALGADQLTKKKARSKNARQIALSRKTGISIKKMQKDLFDKGFAPQGVSEKDFVDGRPGPSTRQAIEDLQDDLQVKADGLYGPGTHKAWKNQDFAYARRKRFADRGVVDRDVAAATKKKAAAAQSAGGNIARLKKAVQDAKINFRTMRSPKGGTPVNDPRYQRAKLQYQKAQALLKKALGQQKLARLKAAQSAKLANRKKASQSGTANIAKR